MVKVGGSLSVVEAGLISNAAPNPQRRREHELTPAALASCPRKRGTG
jgi:hypothetical protein